MADRQNDVFRHGEYWTLWSTLFHIVWSALNALYTTIPENKENFALESPKNAAKAQECSRMLGS
jgi:hypothetical protein